MAGASQRAVDGVLPIERLIPSPFLIDNVVIVGLRKNKVQQRGKKRLFEPNDAFDQERKGHVDSGETYHTVEPVVLWSAAAYVVEKGEEKREIHATHGISLKDESDSERVRRREAAGLWRAVPVVCYPMLPAADGAGSTATSSMTPCLRGGEGRIVIDGRVAYSAESYACLQSEVSNACQEAGRFFLPILTDVQRDRVFACASYVTAAPPSLEEPIAHEEEAGLKRVIAGIESDARRTVAERMASGSSHRLHESFHGVNVVYVENGRHAW